VARDQSPDGIVLALSKLQVKVTRRTLLNYEVWGLIDKPARGGGGTGGRWTEYPIGTTEQAFAAWSLLHGDYSKNDKVMTQLLGEKAPAYSPGIVLLAKIAGAEYLSVLGWDYYEENRAKGFSFNVNTSEEIPLYGRADMAMDKIALKIGEEINGVDSMTINFGEDLPSYFKSIVKAAAYFWIDRYLAAYYELTGSWEYAQDSNGRWQRIMR